MSNDVYQELVHHKEMVIRLRTMQVKNLQEKYESARDDAIRWMREYQMILIELDMERNSNAGQRFENKKLADQLQSTESRASFYGRIIERFLDHG